MYTNSLCRLISTKVNSVGIDAAESCLNVIISGWGSIVTILIKTHRDLPSFNFDKKGISG